MRFTTTFAASAGLALASAQNMSLNALLQQTSQLSALRELINSMPSVADSLSNATNITLFAPSNSAITELRRSGIFSVANQAQVAALLDYHVAQGKIYASDIVSNPQFCPTLLNNTMYTNVTGGQVVEAQLENNSTVVLTSGLKSEANVTQANLNFTGGVVHVIDSVLTIPGSVSSTALAANLTAFSGALESTNLTDTINGASDITIFAPLNAAFEAVGSLALNLSAQALANILEYHVINGTVAYSTDLGNGTVNSLGGDKLHIKVEDDAVFVNAARVVNADILIAGGVMHIIDSVLNPNDTSASPKPSATTPVVMFSSAMPASSLPFTSGLTASTTVSALVATTDDVASGYSTHALQTGGGKKGGKTSSGAAAMPTGGIGAAALFGGAALVANW